MPYLSLFGSSSCVCHRGHLIGPGGFASRGMYCIGEGKFSGVRYGEINFRNLSVLSDRSKINALSGYNLILVEQEYGRYGYLVGFLNFVGERLDQI